MGEQNATLRLDVGGAMVFELLRGMIGNQITIEGRPRKFHFATDDTCHEAMTTPFLWPRVHLLLHQGG
jgi:hypothetical protein